MELRSYGVKPNALMALAIFSPFHPFVLSPFHSFTFSSLEVKPNVLLQSSSSPCTLVYLATR